MIPSLSIGDSEGGNRHASAVVDPEPPSKVILSFWASSRMIKFYRMSDSFALVAAHQGREDLLGTPRSSSFSGETARPQPLRQQAAAQEQAEGSGPQVFRRRTGEQGRNPAGACGRQRQGQEHRHG